jgi:uncharacterized protein
MTEPLELAELKPQPCPVCRKLVKRSSPDRKGVFCSKRCATIDLGRWLNGSYAIPAAGGDEEEHPPGNDDSA